MDRWKAEMGRVREEKRREEERRSKRESLRRKKIQVREKVGKSQNTMFSMICGSGGPKSRLAKAAGAEPAGQMKDENLHAVVARSTFASEKNLKTPHALLEVEMSKKCTLLWREAHFDVKMYKAPPHVRATFGRWSVVLRGRRKGLCTLSKVSKTWGYCSISKNDGKRGTFEEDLQRCIFRGRRSTRDMFIRDVRRWGRWFPERGCILEHQICRFAKMILRDRCSTSSDLASIFRGRRSTLDRWSGKIAKRSGTRPSALHSTFHFWRKSRRIASFLMLSTSKIEEVSQTCFVFDVVKFKNWGSLAELFRFWCCQVQKLRKSRRIASFSSLQIDR